MVEPIVSTVLSLVENFTLKKFIAVCVVLLAIISTVFIYEQYTDNFKLTRLQKSAEVLRILQEIKESDIENNQSLLPIYNDIQNELATLSDPANPASLSFEPSNSGFKKFGAAFTPWGLMALVSYIQQKRKTAKEPSLVLGFITVGIIFGFIGYMLPTILWPWVNLFIYPILLVLFIAVVGITIPQFKAYRNRAQKVKEGLTK